MRLSKAPVTPIARPSVLRLVLLALALLLSSPAFTANVLKNNRSPYLAIHGNDPVDWQEWNASSVERARREHKLLFVSIGYFSCHWCHVMQRESYQNPEIARFLNQHFVPVKVDRELNAALDADMQDFAARTAKQSGWPLNVFITPDGYPLVAVLYLPPNDFLTALKRLNQRWQADGDKLGATAKSAQRARSAANAAPMPAVNVDAKQLVRQFVATAMASADTARGGFGSGNKFPLAPQLMALLDAYSAEPSEDLKRFLVLTLDRMGTQGLYDHIGGGFFRYTTDPDWQTPHFEKMLYDNALLASVYLQAAKLFDRPDYRSLAFATLDFVREEMTDKASKAFITSTSAVDTQNREGGVYLWKAEELRSRLNPAEFALIARIWKIEGPAKFEAGYLPSERVTPTPAERAQLGMIYKKLKAARAERIIPKDDKVLVSMNGLVLAAFADAARENRTYARAASDVARFIGRMVVAKEGLKKGMSRGALLTQAADLEDFAFAAWGMQRYEQNRLGTGALISRSLAADAWKRFFEPTGWKLEQLSLLAEPSVQAVIADGTTPSPSSLILLVSALSGDAILSAAARGASKLGYAGVLSDPYDYATQVRAIQAIR